MSDDRTEMEKLMLQLERQRDELKLKLHLAKADVRDEWNKMEKKWDELRGKAGQGRKVLDETSESVGAAARLLADEIKKGYERLSKLF